MFDSSATFSGHSLNNVLLQGPDKDNRIIRVLTRFRHGKFGFSGDIESMFHGFYVNPYHRDYLRFFWWSNNDCKNEIVSYRAKVHVFGNTCSPAIANFALRHATTHPKAQKYPIACKQIEENFHVDDLLAGAESVQEAIETLRKVREILGRYNLRLHKIIASDKNITDAFPTSELAVNTETVELNENQLQRTLGLLWRVSSDEFILRVNYQIDSLLREVFSAL